MIDSADDLMNFLKRRNCPTTVEIRYSDCKTVGPGELYNNTATPTYIAFRGTYEEFVAYATSPTGAMTLDAMRHESPVVVILPDGMELDIFPPEVVAGWNEEDTNQ